MSLVNTVDRYEFKRTMKRIDRDYYSYEAIDALLQLFDEIGGNVEFDPIAICCEFTEDTPEYFYEQYDNIDRIAESKDENGDLDIDALLDALNYYTYAVLLDNGNILIQDF